MGHNVRLCMGMVVLHGKFSRNVVLYCTCIVDNNNWNVLLHGNAPYVLFFLFE